MIYSDEINKVCGLCLFASPIEGDEELVRCEKKRRDKAVTCVGCRKFKYDILKRTARRKQKKLKTYSSSDFELV